MTVNNFPFRENETRKSKRVFQTWQKTLNWAEAWMLRDISIRYKNLVLVVASLIGVLVVSVMGLVELRANLLEDRKERVRSVVEVVRGVLDEFAVKAGTGELEVEEAQRQAALMVSSLRFGEGEYFWINDMSPRMIVHPYRVDLVGRNVADLTDMNGKHIIRDFVETVRREGAGYVSYMWPKPGNTEPVEKISYVRGHRPWGWVVGSGIYIGDIDAIFWRQAELLGLTALGILLIVVGISWWLSLNITNPLRAITASMSRLSSGDTSVPPFFVDRGDEMGDLARAMDIFRRNAIEIDQLRAERERLKERERKTLRESEERFRDFAEASSDWLWETDAAGRITYVSSRIIDNFEFSSEDLVGRTALEFAERLGCRDQLNAYEEATGSNTAFRDLRFDIANENGDPRILRLSGKPRVDENGGFLGYRGTGTDITPEVMASRREERANKRFMSAIVTFPIGIVLFDAEDRLVVCNDRYREINPVGAVLRPGITFEELVRATVEQGVATLAKGREEEYVQARIAHHRDPSESLEIKFLNRWVTIYEYRTEAGDTLLVTMDITDKKNAEEALKASEEKFRGLFEHANDSIFLTDVGTGEVLEANANAEKSMGCIGGEVTSKKIQDFLFAVKGNEPLELIEVLGEGGKPSVVEAEQVLPDGSRIPVEISAKLTQYGSRPAIQSIVRDISSRKEMQQQLVDAQKMRAVGELTGGIAHDFNNLLTVIMGSLDWLREIVRDDERALNLVCSALEAAQRGSNLTKSLLAYARRQALSPETVELRETFDVIRPLLAQALPESISLEMDVDDGLWPVMADPVQLESAILNLAFNARDAMPESGRLILRARNGLPGENLDTEAGRHVFLSFSDTGTGMPAAVLKKACDPFFTTKEVGQGSGLGLSMVKGFVEQSGGRLTIESVEGEGTTVTLSLPRAVVKSGSIPWSADFGDRIRAVFLEEEIEEKGRPCLEEGT